MFPRTEKAARFSALNRFAESLRLQSRLSYAGKVKFAPQEVRTYFVTSVCANRRRIFQVAANAELMLDHLQVQRAKRRMSIHAFVLMPDHIHLLITPAPEVSLEKAMQFIKGGFSFRLKSRLDIWERSSRERRIRDSGEFDTAKRYIEMNPVRGHLAPGPEQFLYSSAATSAIVDGVPPWFL